MQKTLTGQIIGTKMQQTAVVEVVSWKINRLLGKRYRQAKRYLAHNPANEYQIGEEVELTSSRPLSKLKHFIITKRLSSQPTDK